MKTFIIKNLEIEEVNTDRPVYLEYPNNNKIPLVRGKNFEPTMFPEIKRIEVNPVHYFAPDGNEYFIASHPQVAKKLQYQIDEVFELCNTRDRLYNEKNKLIKEKHGLQERNICLVKQLIKYETMSFWKRLKFAFTGTCL